MSQIGEQFGTIFRTFVYVGDSERLDTNDLFVIEDLFYHH